MKKLIFLFTLFFFFIVSAQIRGKVIKVFDGDTFYLLTQENYLYKIRVADIDTPECRQAFGNEAKQFTFSQIFGKIIEVKKTKNDIYGRTVGYVFYDQNKDLAQELLKVGLAWIWRFSNNKNYKQLQIFAKKTSKGLWSDHNSIDPYLWRKKNKNKRIRGIMKI